MQWPASYTRAVTSSLSGGGTVTITGGTHTFPAGTFNPTGTVNFTAGTTTINNTFAPASLGAISSGLVTFNAPQTFPNLTISGGEVAGPADVTVTGAMAWTSGAMSGTGVTVVAAGGTLSMTSDGG